MNRLAIFIIITISAIFNIDAITLEKIPYGDMNQWVSRSIKESGIIGGKTRTLYEIAPTATITGAKAYKNMGGSPWGTSNVYARVAGITKTSNAVYYEERETGDKCAKLCTILENVKALGIINMDVLVSGSIFLGEMIEPVKSTKDPYSKMDFGMKYTKCPDYLVYDYKVTAPNDTKIYSSGFGSKKKLKDRDQAEVFVFLQKRWEDADGNIHALRVGTARERYGTTQSTWVNGHKLKIHYGDITKQSFFKSYMGLLPEDRSYHARNSKGEMVPVIEEGWAPVGTAPTHAIMMASSGCGTAYEGTVGMIFWIDNVAFGFE